MTRRLQVPLLSLALASQIVLAVAGSSFVLCNEANGESTLEWALAGCCGSPALANAAEPSASLEDCGACADGARDLSLQRDDAFSLVLAASACLVLDRSIAVCAASASAITAQAPRAPPGLASLRTVALRL
jgi:hypothetical protein